MSDNLPAPSTDTPLNPMQREAVRLYTDPLLPTFGKPLASATAAGYETNDVMYKPHVRAEIERIERMRAESGRKVADYMARYTLDAARELVRQLSAGAELRVIDPSPLLDPEQADLPPHAEAWDAEAVEEYFASRLDHANAITKANRVAIQAAKERRGAVELLLRYHLGHPEQRIRHTEDKRLPDELDLSDLSHAELKELGSVIESARRMRSPEKDDGAATPKDDDPVIEGEFSVES